MKTWFIKAMRKDILMFDLYGKQEERKSLTAKEKKQKKIKNKLAKNSRKQNR